MMAYRNVHHLIDALAVDRDGQEIGAADVVVGVLRLSDEYIKEADNATKEFNEISKELPFSWGRAGLFREYMMATRIRIVSLSNSLMPNPGVYIDTNGEGGFIKHIMKDFLCARALIESVAVFDFSCSKMLMAKSEEELWDFCKKSIFSSKLGDDVEKRTFLEGMTGFESPIRVTKAVADLANEFPYVGRYYDIFSEFCHPNGFGLFVFHHSIGENSDGSLGIEPKWLMAYGFLHTKMLVSKFRNTFTMYKGVYERLSK